MTPSALAYQDFVAEFMCQRKSGMPHCDSLVLHDPGLCKYCGMKKYVPVQLERKRLGLNWTGSVREDLEPCPAEQMRGLERLERWHGNVLVDDEEEEDLARELAELVKALTAHLSTQP